MYAASSKSLMVKNPWECSSVRIWVCIGVMNVSLHTCQSPEGVWQTPPIPVREVYMALIHEDGCGLIYHRCVGLAANDATRWRHTVSSSLTGMERFIRLPFFLF